ncbi:MAG: type 2 periplasmic-binding domain-containing protein [Planctomycetota bacterium]|jgi:transcriptional regulator NrdR family protein
MKIQLKVVKADGSTEEYLHTKVIGTISNALSCIGKPDIHIAEHLAEVVTYFLYHKQKRRRITSGEIFSIIKAVLAATKYEDAAIALNEHNFGRKLKRSRIEVVSIDVQQLSDADMLRSDEESNNRSRWDKSIIVDNLVTKHGVTCQTARTIASMVEEKIFNMGITLVPASLIKQLVLGDTAAVLRAQRQLQTV